MMFKKDQKKKNKLRSMFGKISIFFNHLLFPENIKCIFCGKDIPNFDEKPYCEECEKVLSFNNKNKCMICSEPIDNEATVCDFCQKNKRFFKKAYCPFVYDGIVRKAILGYKDSNHRYIASTFAKFIADEILKDKISVDLITYVPMTKKKTKRRTFNQSKLLAEKLSEILNAPVEELFVKTQDLKSQKSSTYAERQKNITQEYALKNNVHLKKSQTVLIVDDIITTGATVNFLSKLIHNKVKNVYVCSIARNKLNKYFGDKTEEKQVDINFI